ncbi:MAG: hypothetical protein AABX34_04710 [Nanoarchaeota archaeon]
MKPNQTTLDEQNRQGYSFLYNVDPRTEAQYKERTGQDGLVTYVPVALTGSLSPIEIIAKHAPKLGVQPDELRVVMDAYRNEQFNPSIAESLKRMAAVFVRTEGLEGVLERNPTYRAFQH